MTPTILACDLAPGDRFLSPDGHHLRVHLAYREGDSVHVVPFAGRPVDLDPAMLVNLDIL